MGFLAVILMLLFMLFGLNELGQSPAANRVRLAEGIRAQFKFESVGAGVADEPGKRVLRIGYTTLQDSKFDVSVQNREMQGVAEFAAKTYNESDRKFIDEIRVRRTEIKGSGCWQKSYPGEFAMTNPFKANEAPFSPFPVQPPGPRNP